MKKIKYFQTGDKYLILKSCGREDGMVEIDLGKDFSGKLIIGKCAYKIEGGRTVIDTLNLDDGPQELFAMENKKSHFVEGFEKQGNKIIISPLSDSCLRELLKKASYIEEKLSALEEACRANSDKIAHTTIF